MLGLAGLLSVMAGGVVAYLADRFPEHIELFETAAGVLLIGGLVLVSYGLPAIL
jgi:hypothetical protein